MITLHGQYYLAALPFVRFVSKSDVVLHYVQRQDETHNTEGRQVLLNTPYM